MFKKILVAALATTALATGAPGASADPVMFDCNFNSVQQESVTGQNYEGVAWGHVAHAEGGPVSIRCYITVNGAEVSSTPTGTGIGGATTAHRVTFTASDTDTVRICGEATTWHGPEQVCYDQTNIEIPPQAIRDLIDSIDALGTVDSVAVGVLDAVDSATVGALDAAEQVRVPWERLPALHVEQTITHNTDYIVITDSGTGPRVSTQGAFANPNWWSCTTSTAAGPVTVRCVAAPVWQSGRSWKCDVMDVTAHALTNHRNVYDWAQPSARDAVAESQRTVDESPIGGTGRRAPNVPDPNDISWGQAAGLLACDGATLETATASQAQPTSTATATFGATWVTEFVCEARYAYGVAQAPVAPYSVNCLDPGVPGVG